MNSFIVYPFNSQEDDLTTQETEEQRTIGEDYMRGDECSSCF